MSWSVSTMTEISRVDCNISTLRDLLPVIRKSFTGTATSSQSANIKALHLHSNRIKSLDRDVLNLVGRLTTLDVSSNYIEKLEGLEGMTLLIDLNLANNKIKRIEGLKSLQNLRRLNLSFNRIKTLEGMVELHGDHYSLMSLDLKGNELEHADQLAYIAGCTHLRDISLNTEGYSTRVNPICKAQDYSRAMVFSMLPQLVIVDGQDDSANPKSSEELFSDLPDISKYQSFLNDFDLISQPIQPIIPSTSISKPTLKTTPAIDSALARYRRPASAKSGCGTPPTIMPSNRSLLDERLDRLESRLDDILKASRENIAPQPSQPTAPILPQSPPRAEPPALTSSKPNPLPSTPASDRLTRLEIILDQLLSRFEGPEALAREVLKTPSIEKNTSKTMDHDRLESLESQMSTLVEFLTGKRKPASPPKKSNMHRPGDDESDDVIDGQTSEADFTVSVIRDSKNCNSSKKLPVPSKGGGLASKSSKTKLQPDFSASNAKLLSALDNEEKRLKESEAKALSEIQLLNENMRIQTDRADTAEAKLKEQHGELEVAKKGVEEAKGLSVKVTELEQIVAELNTKLSFQITATIENERKATEASIALAMVEAQLKKKETECEASKKICCDVEIALSNAESQLRASEADKTRVSVRFVKEREQSKVRIAQVRRENDIYQNTIKQLQREVSGLQAQLSTRDGNLQRQLQDSYNNHAQELDSVVTSATMQLMDRHKDEVDRLMRNLANTREAYMALEEEYRKGLKDERAKTQEAQLALQDANRKLNEQTAIISEVSRKETEMTAMIRDLTSLVKEQKARIADLTDKNQLSFSVFEEQMRTLESKLKNAQKAKAEMKNAQKESAASHSEHVARKAALEAAEAERTRLTSELANQTATFQQEKSRLDARVKQLEDEKARIEKQFEADEQALRVKNKMLDDQNETIRTLKHNLENKSREHQLLAGDVSKREGKLEEQLSIEHQANRDMRRELDAQEKLVEQLQSLAEEYRQERDTLRKEYVEVSRRLKERNDSIQKIEEEVTRVRTVFKAKEDKLIKEKEMAIKAREKSMDDLRLSYETQSSRLALLEREREGMAQSIMSLQRKVEEATLEKKQHESEMRVLLTEMDRQKQKMEARMAKLRVAVQEDT
ncbi:hypothetical protein SeMB42_g00790 [Synchytrium endobioticum]|uniref:U2A'/phosphoprotein 32 family A C-terminal domain-containing protein n=1 Tax=Synchytrium endobioticum TaxID=286115 RepID=A0A507DQF1_9FUNG|nr:hypothetical protein SeLEV6574_g00288 [Synchytrium endobioticum]TPX53407.1 hypothetical protein SeMB42_g00790 [Synchytrium endobioticum]